MLILTINPFKPFIDLFATIRRGLGKVGKRLKRMLVTSNPKNTSPEIREDSGTFVKIQEDVDSVESDTQTANDLLEQLKSDREGEQALLKQLKSDTEREQALLEQLKSDREGEQALLEQLKSDREGEQALLKQLKSDTEREQALLEQLKSDTEREQALLEQLKSDKDAQKGFNASSDFETFRKNVVKFFDKLLNK